MTLIRYHLSFLLGIALCKWLFWTGSDSTLVTICAFSTVAGALAEYRDILVHENQFSNEEE